MDEIKLDDIIYPSFLFKSEKSDTFDNAFIPNNPLAFLSDKPKLKNIVSHLCKQLHHPVALIDYKALLKMNTEKLESMVEMFPMRRSCSIFRKCAGEEYCSECDFFHARCMDIDKLSIEKRIRENLDRVPSFFYPEYGDRLPIVVEGFDRPVIEYHCPMLGYRELLFPLMYKGSVYGVFFAGQIMVYHVNDNKEKDKEEDEDINKKISESFFKKNRPEELFSDYVIGYNAQDSVTNELACEFIKTLIIDSDRDARQYDDILGFPHPQKKELEYYSKNFRTYEDYLGFIDNVCGAIAEAERELDAAYEDRRKQIFSKILRDIADTFFEAHSKIHNLPYKNKHDASTEELDSAWYKLKMVFASEILRQFKSVESIYVFGDSQGIRIETTGKKEIVFAVPFETNKPKGTFDFSLNSIEGINDSTNSLKNLSILAGLSEGLPRENCILIQCHDISMLLIVKDLNEHIALYTAMADVIEKELVRINSTIALCSANLTKEKYLLTLRMYRHENAHISTRLMGNINRYFEIENGGQRFREADAIKRQLICNDLKNTVQLISNIADNISFVTGTGIAANDPQKDVKPLNVVDMLYKWQIMFRDELENKNLEIIVYRGGYDSSTVGYKMAVHLLKNAAEITRENRKYEEAPSVITINARLFELLVYNIVDNAVKYAYIGTNIYLIWSRVDNEYELSVTSYGPLMPEGDSMYGLYVRGNDERSVSGDGLGLYVVKRIAEKLGLKVSHNKSEKISCYNAPLIPWYSKTDFSKVKGYTKIQESDLNSNNDAQQVFLATNNYPPTKIKETNLTPDYLKENIQMETWRTTFRIRIPIKNKKNP